MSGGWEYLGEEGIEWRRFLVDKGNLTLTGYNSELSNMSFDKKRSSMLRVTSRNQQIFLTP
ncbi:hypothetical protein MASR2M39_19570 [Ignavibacteriales bacterium]